jgi:HEAT repeat protein
MLPSTQIKQGKEMSSLEDYMKELRDTGKPLVVSKLVNLSDPSSEELAVFDRVWPTIDVARRREIAEHLAELAGDNLDLDFDKVLRTCLFDADSEVKIRAMGGLLECEERSLLDPLINLLMGDLEHTVRAAAASTLGTFALLVEFGELSANDAAKVEKALFTAYNNKNEPTDVRCRALEAVSTISKPEVEELIRQAYQSNDLEFRASALFAMGRNCNRSWLPVIMKELHSPQALLRFEAVRACGELEAEESVPRLIELIRDEDAQIRLAAIDSLGRIGGQQAKKTLQDCLEDEDEAISEAAQDAMDELKFWEDPLAL